MLYLSKNLKYLREYNGKISQGKLADEVGSTRSAISSYEDGRAEPKLETLNKLADYFKVNLDQLINQNLTRLGEIARENEEDIEKYVAGNNLRILATTVDADDNEHIELIPVKAAAGYTTGYADAEYLSELPKYRIPFLPGGKTYRAFEIRGDSMLPLLPNSIVIGEYMVDWNDVKNGDICVVVSKSEGIVLKKVYNQLKDRGVFLLKSTNLAYSPFELPGEDIVEIWKFAAYVSRQFPEESHAANDLRSAFLRLEDDLREIKLAQKAN